MNKNYTLIRTGKENLFFKGTLVAQKPSKDSDISADLYLIADTNTWVLHTKEGKFYYAEAYNDTKELLKSATLKQNTSIHLWVVNELNKRIKQLTIHDQEKISI